jgi:uncharacterized HAD superfamily protein
MKVGIDIDEVVVEFVRHFLKIHKDKTGEDFDYNSVNSYNLWEPLNISKEKAFSYFYAFEEYGFHDNPNFIQFSKEAINEISSKMEIFFLTARSNKLKAKTKNFLIKTFKNKEINIFHSGDSFKNGNKSKAELCNEIGISLLIEDQKDIAENCANNGIKVLLFDKPWNKEIEHKNIIKVSGWKEALKKINEIENESK